MLLVGLPQFSQVFATYGVPQLSHTVVPFSALASALHPQACTSAPCQANRLAALWRCAKFGHALFECWSDIVPYCLAVAL